MYTPTYTSDRTLTYTKPSNTDLHRDTQTYAKPSNTEPFKNAHTLRRACLHKNTGQLTLGQNDTYKHAYTCIYMHNPQTQNKAHTNTQSHTGEKSEYFPKEISSCLSRVLCRSRRRREFPYLNQLEGGDVDMQNPCVSSRSAQKGFDQLGARTLERLILGSSCE